MSIKLGKTKKQYKLSFPQEITIYTVSSLRDRLLELLISFGNEKERTINLDFSATHVIDWPGIQLIISFVKSLRQAEFNNIKLVASVDVMDNFELLGIEDLLAIHCQG